MESVITNIRIVIVFLVTVAVTGIFAFYAFYTGMMSAEPAEITASNMVKRPVLTGIDVLQREGFSQLAGRNIGLITNQTGITREGISDIQLLHDAGGVNLLAIFSPEHGLSGKLDISLIENSEDSLTGIKVFSLYGSTRVPTRDMLTGIDTLVFDIQDIGTRFYTYISTMGHAMQAAAENNIRFVVLDRPNPINGITVSGPVLDEGRQSFVGFHRLPVRHGMTSGELSRMFKAELLLELDLVVIQLEHWQRAEYFDTTGLKWINPSPNMRSLTEAILYPGIGLLETTNLSVGRGTDSPFELLGAPWLDGNILAWELKSLKLPGVSFDAIEFTPESSKFEGELCSGINIHITNREQFNSVQTGLEIALQLQHLYPQIWEINAYDRLLGSKATLEAIRQGLPFSKIEAIFSDGLLEFAFRRSQYLIYE
jgi:uncharacterized protein YbbC (DUF1343 family)